VPITSHLFEAYLKCQTKCFLRSLGETATGNGYSDWVQAQQASYRSEEIKRLTQEAAQNQCVIRSIDREDVQSAKWNFAVETTVRAQNLESTIHAVERMVLEGREKLALFIPIRFIFRNKLHKDAKLLLAFDAFVLSKVLGREVSLGKIIHGNSRATLKVDTGALVSEAQRLSEKIGALLSSDSPPDDIVPSASFKTNADRRRLRKTISACSQASPRSNARAIAARGYSPHAAFLHFQAPQSAQESKESCSAALLCAAGARHSGKHCLYSRNSSFS
jgi:hypothetical protein